LVLQDSLNKVFNQAYVFMNVTVAPAHSFAFDLNNNGLDAPNATLMSKYSAEMKALRDDYFATNNQENKLYLFVVDDIEGDLKGYMVRGKSVGFIDASNSSSPNYLRTYAHEIG